MSASDHERKRLEMLAAMLRENHVTRQDARKEARTGPQAAYREELASRPCWKIKTKRRQYVESLGTD